MTTRTIQVNYLARVEGEGALTLLLDAGEVVSAQLKLFEPPRLFEAMLRGRGCLEAPDITARICGICPVAYQMSACHAVEHALGMRLPDELRALRRLLYCGEWIESHVLHMVMLHVPDFLGLPDAMALAKLQPERVRAALQIKKAGNAIVATLGGREVHPVNVRVGGFYRLPTASELALRVPELEAALEKAEELVDWLATLEYPEFSRDYELVSLGHAGEYPMNEGRLVSTAGLDIAADEFDAHIVEDQVAYSTALHARIVERGAYLVGPLARFVNNAQHLGPRAREAARRARLDPSCRNPFRMLLVRGVETVHALEEALRIVASLSLMTGMPTGAAACEPQLRAGVGYSITEAPRGILYHRYAIDAQGTIEDARIVPPTSQNQRSIELDLVAMGGVLASLPLEEATRRAEHAIRNHDPCISCSTHFLRLAFEQASPT